MCRVRMFVDPAVERRSHVLARVLRKEETAARVGVGKGGGVVDEASDEDQRAFLRFILDYIHGVWVHDLKGRKGWRRTHMFPTSQQEAHPRLLAMQGRLAPFSGLSASWPERLSRFHLMGTPGDDSLSRVGSIGR